MHSQKVKAQQGIHKNRYNEARKNTKKQQYCIDIDK